MSWSLMVKLGQPPRPALHLGILLGVARSWGCGGLSLSWPVLLVTYYDPYYVAGLLPACPGAEPDRRRPGRFLEAGVGVGSNWATLAPSAFGPGSGCWRQGSGRLLTWHMPWGGTLGDGSAGHMGGASLRGSLRVAKRDGRCWGSILCKTRRKGSFQGAPGPLCLLGSWLVPRGLVRSWVGCCIGQAHHPKPRVS